MPSKSKAQQHLMGMALAAKRGKGHYSGKVQEVAEGMSEKQLHDFAKTKSSNLPEKKAFLEGFVKRAFEYGLTSQEAVNILKQANQEAAAPTLEQINAYYKGFGDLLKSNAIHAKSVEKKDIVKDVPITSGYREFVDEAKKQKIGLIKRHLIAMMSRPSVWAGSNAMFVPQGDKGLVISPKKINADVLRHELGHAEDYARLGGEKGFEKEYSPGFRETRNMPPRELYNRMFLLPEARAWHYAGKSVPLDPNDPNRVRDKAFNSYVNYVDQMALD